MRSTTIGARFWSRVRKSAKCWEWQGCTAGAGYGQLYVGENEPGGRMAYAHRISWALHNGEIPAGMSVCHHCDNPLCVRPDHLFLGTDADNMQDAQRKGRLSVTGKGWQRRTTHCPKGHPYSVVNTYHTTSRAGNPARVCRKCAMGRTRAYYKANRDAILARRAKSSRRPERDSSGKFVRWA